MLQLIRREFMKFNKSNLFRQRKFIQELLNNVKQLNSK